MSDIVRAKPTSTHRAFFNDLQAVGVKYNGQLTTLEMLALAAQFVGELAALQNQASMTPEGAAEVINANIQEGNRAAISAARSMPVAGHA